MKKIIQILVDFMVRAILGLALIFFTIQFWIYQEMPITVGINAISLLVSGALGFPGVAALYGMVALAIL